MIFAPHPFCDNFFYRVLPMFDCVYVLGGVGKDLDRFSSRFEPRLAEKTNHRDEEASEEYKASTDQLSEYAKLPVQKEEFTNEMINCTDIKWQYHEHSTDIVFEILGIFIQCVALNFAVKSQKLIPLKRQKKIPKQIKV
ncbi:Oidioi.mRNA.OKI2018_I69.PAR.g10581.t1.cds [Oikopleura dioica]|uniref:Oidioi.mRNA.OKI2018_I69.PAR.g10581.t1.cds n=1 Tax=Oikopleura dioica TaxID=34765 RepID=A0ABN7RRC1_OIKDI|nr:Oidioi.mRNA.OKI2018_I69.PAR.g10581.t1.cds [Oikopleura dioica]